MRVRAATAVDIPAMMAIERESPEASHWSRQQYEALVSSPERTTIVIEEDSLVQGFLVTRMIAQEWEIENIAVAAQRRRGGVGTTLLKRVIELARQNNADAIFLEVRETNRAASSLYEKNGFVLSGRRPGYYQSPNEDALIYRLAIR